MSLRRFILNLIRPSRMDSQVQPPVPKTSEEYSREVEIETERRRGMHGGAYGGT